MLPPSLMQPWHGQQQYIPQIGVSAQSHDVAYGRSLTRSCSPSHPGLDLSPHFACSPLAHNFRLYYGANPDYPVPQATLPAENWGGQPPHLSSGLPLSVGQPLAYDLAGQQGHFALPETLDTSPQRTGYTPGGLRNNFCHSTTSVPNGTSPTRYVQGNGSLRFQAQAPQPSRESSGLFITGSSTHHTAGGASSQSYRGPGPAYSRGRQSTAGPGPPYRGHPSITRPHVPPAVVIPEPFVLPRGNQDQPPYPSEQPIDLRSPTPPRAAHLSGRLGTPTSPDPERVSSQPHGMAAFRPRDPSLSDYPRSSRGRTGSRTGRWDNGFHDDDNDHAPVASGSGTRASNRFEKGNGATAAKRELDCWEFRTTLS